MHLMTFVTCGGASMLINKVYPPSLSVKLKYLVCITGMKQLDIDVSPPASFFDHHIQNRMLTEQFFLRVYLDC